MKRPKNNNVFRGRQQDWVWIKKALRVVGLYRGLLLDLSVLEDIPDDVQSEAVS
jgi:hypothetical protein